MARQKRKKDARAREPAESPWYRHRWRIGGGAGIGGALAILVALLLLPGTSPIFFPDASQPPDFDFGEGQGAPLVYVPRWNPCLEDWRPDYGLACERQQRVFGHLPNAPRDLSDRAEQVYLNEVSLERLMRASPTGAIEYWSQPEFWPAWNMDRLNQTLWPPVPQWTVFGFKFYTVAKGLTVGQDALDLGYAEMRILLRPAWGEDLWQGFHLYPVYPTSAMKQDGTPMLDRPDGGQPITQVPDDVPFRVTIESPSNPMYVQMLRDGIAADDRRDGGQFLVLPPTYPGFPVDWARMLTLRITFTSPDPQPGVWFFALYTANPSAAVDEEYSFHYGLFYESAGEWPVSPIAPLFQGFVVV